MRSWRQRTIRASRCGPNVTNPWLDRHIFPGGYSPALSEVFRAVERAGLVATDCEILRLHYAQTIAHWRARFTGNRDRILALTDERFCRMFDLYLAGSELTFRHLGHMVWQLQMGRHQDAVPLTRAYMLDERRRNTAEALLPAAFHPGIVATATRQTAGQEAD